VFVDCDANSNAIQNALDAGELEITFTGTCGDVEIEGINNVELVGTGIATAVIDGVVDIEGASNIRLSDFTVSPISADPLETEIRLNRGSYVSRMQDVVIDGRLRVLRNSGADLRSTDITRSVGDGSTVVVLRNSFLRLREDNSITSTNPAAPAIHIGSNSSLIVRDGGTVIVGSPFAVRVRAMSIAENRVGNIMGDVAVELHSVVSIGGGEFDVGDASVSGNVTIGRDSALVFDLPAAGDGTVTFNGTATCLDGESSISGSPSGTGVISCTGFSLGPPQADGRGNRP